MTKGTETSGEALSSSCCISEMPPNLADLTRTVARSTLQLRGPLDNTTQTPIHYVIASILWVYTPSPELSLVKFKLLKRCIFQMLGKEKCGSSWCCAVQSRYLVHTALRRRQDSSHETYWNGTT